MAYLTIVGTADGLATTDRRVTTNTFVGERLTTSTISSTATAEGAIPRTDNRTLNYAYDLFGSLLTIKTRKDAGEGAGGGFELSTQYTYDPYERLLSSRDDQDKDGAADGDHQVYCYDALDRRDRRVVDVKGIPDQGEQRDSFEVQRAEPVKSNETLSRRV